MKYESAGTKQLSLPFFDFAQPAASASARDGMGESSPSFGLESQTSQLLSPQDSAHCSWHAALSLGSCGVLHFPVNERRIGVPPMDTAPSGSISTRSPGSPITLLTKTDLPSTG
jgi:hypothetical protein